MNHLKVLDKMLKEEIKLLNIYKKSGEIKLFDVANADLRLDGAIYYLGLSGIASDRGLQKFLTLKYKKLKPWYRRIT